MSEDQLRAEIRALSGCVTLLVERVNVIEQRLNASSYLGSHIRYPMPTCQHGTESGCWCDSCGGYVNVR